MNFPFYIAKRYFISKKSHHIINIISWISIFGISIGTMSLIIVLSVFNGFQSLVTNLFSAFNPDIKITAKYGKTFHTYSFPAYEIKQLPEVAYYTEVIEENALLKYNDKQFISIIKGVKKDYNQMNKFDTLIVKGKYLLEKNETDYALIGYGVANNLGINLIDFSKSIAVYIPKRGQIDINNPMGSFNVENICASGFFSVQQEIDSKYIIVPLRFARKLLEYKDEVSSIEIGLKLKTHIPRVQNKICKIIGGNFLVKNHYEQEALLFKIMKSEKWAVYLILTFILIIAIFNVIGSVTMLILDKKKDISIITSMGADTGIIRRIFLIEGLIINLIGCISGLIFGGLVCFLQINYKLVKLQSSGTFIINAYPVKMELIDFISVFATVILIGLIAVYYPSHQISKKYISEKL